MYIRTYLKNGYIVTKVKGNPKLVKSYADTTKECK